jgi:hypothetical protein
MVYIYTPDGHELCRHDINWFNYVEDGSGRIYLFEKRESTGHCACVPSGWMVSFRKMEISQPAEVKTDEAAVDRILNFGARKVPNWKLSKLKKLLAEFNSKGGFWKTKATS